MYTKKEIAELFRMVKEANRRLYLWFKVVNGTITEGLVSPKMLENNLKAVPALYAMMYTKPLSELPLLINDYYFGVVALWRLKIGK